MTERILYGLGASPGIAQGKVVVIEHGDIKVPKYHIESGEIDGEIERFNDALERAEAQLDTVMQDLEHSKYTEHRSILDTHKMILRDEMLTRQVLKRIRYDKMNAEWAVKITVDEITTRFAMLEDPYFRERKADVYYAGYRLIHTLLGSEPGVNQEIPQDAVVVAHDLSPADTAAFFKKPIKAILTDLGGRNSHTSIIARSLEIPAVVGLQNITELAGQGDLIVVDGSHGEVVIDPSDERLVDYSEKAKNYNYFRETLRSEIELPPHTQDGRTVLVSANIEIEQEVDNVVAYRADGIGLYRTEFLFTDRSDFPTEEEHFEVYRRIAERMGEHPVTIRVFDLGGDKFVRDSTGSREANPALGLRAVRFLISQPSLFRDQVAGILRASAYGNLKLLLPMISSLEELRNCLAVIEQTKDELIKSKVQFDEQLKVGVMIEVPSAAIIADQLAGEIDFFSIGTNDLAQYLLAVDRSNQKVAYLYNTVHPAMLRVLNSCVEVAKKTGTPVAICGEMAGDPLYTLVLLAMGFKEFSMNTISIPVIKHIIRASSTEGARAVLDKVWKLETAAEITNFLKTEMVNRFPAFSHWLM